VRLIALAVSLAVAAACDPAAVILKQGPQKGGTVVEAIVGEAQSLNPLFSVEDNARDIDSLVYQGLVTVDAAQNPVPLLAKSMSVSDDRMTYAFRLRTDVMWADGQPFTAEDVLFTFHTMQGTAYDQPQGQFWKEVKVELNGVDEVRFVLKAPSASFPYALRQGIIPHHIFKGVAVQAMALDPHSAAKAFGTGPFMVDSISENRKSVTLKRSPHAAPAPNLDQVVFRSYPTLADAVDAVSRGEADAVGALQPPQLGTLAKRPDLQINELRTFSFAAALFNVNPGMSVYFNPPAVRQALTQAVDRRAVLSVLDKRADAAPGPIPPTDWAYDREAAGKYPFDLAVARQTLDATGWVLPPGGGAVRQRSGKDFSISIVTADSYPYVQVADLLAKEFAAVGVQLTVDVVPSTVLVSRYLVGKKYEMALVAFDNGPDPDQFGLWHSSNSTDSLNFSSPLLPKQALIDKDLEDGRATADHKLRKQAYSDFQDLMSDAAPAVFLYEPHYAYIVSKRVHGVRSNPVVEPVDRFQYVTEWWVDVKRG
jgi:peptide/nickel transport system substrate-binding protein